MRRVTYHHLSEVLTSVTSDYVETETIDSSGVNGVSQKYTKKHHLKWGRPLCSRHYYSCGELQRRGSHAIISHLWLRWVTGNPGTSQRAFGHQFLSRGHVQFWDHDFQEDLPVHGFEPAAPLTGVTSWFSSRYAVLSRQPWDSRKSLVLLKEMVWQALRHVNIFLFFSLPCCVEVFRSIMVSKFINEWSIWKRFVLSGHVPVWYYLFDSFNSLTRLLKTLVIPCELL